MKELRRSASCLLFALAAVGLAACGDDDDPTPGAGPLVPQTSTADEEATADVPAAVDCDTVEDAHLELSTAAQPLVSLVSNAQFALIADGTLDVDFAEVQDAIGELRVLEDVENPIGSVADSLDTFSRLVALADEAADDADPESTDAFAELQTVIGDDASVLAAMGPVNYAVGEACRT